MGAALELGKLVTASYVYQQWNSINVLMRTYFVVSVVVLSLLTSMGIFGFLSKAHSDQSLVSGDVLARITVYDEKIKVAKENVDANRKALKQMDEAVDQVMGRSQDEKGAEKAVAIRRSQQKERTRLQEEIQTYQAAIGKLNEDRAPIAAEVRKVEAEVGPIKYIAAFMYGATDTGILEKAVSWMIVLIIVVFDPLAILLVIGANSMLKSDKKRSRYRNLRNSIEIDKSAVFSFKNKDIN
jgi:peptidoglycan hydrolase CwlO-like protein